MKRSNSISKSGISYTVGQYIGQSVFSFLFGSISGIVWALVLEYPARNGIKYGGLIGVILGTIVFFNKLSYQKRNSNIETKEVDKATGTLMGTFLIISIIFAGITWLIRLFI